MNASRLSQKIAQRKADTQRSENEAVLTKLFERDVPSFHWKEDISNAKLAEEILALNNIVLEVPTGRDSYILKAIEQINAFIKPPAHKVISLSIRLPTYAFTSWVAIDGLAFPKFLYNFLHQYQAIVFLVKTETEILVFGQTETELQIHAQLHQQSRALEI